MKALYRGASIVLIPETDCEADSLVWNESSGKFLMARCNVNGQPVPCWEFPVGTAEVKIIEAINGSVQ